MGSLSAVTAAKKLGGPITAFVAGGNIKSVAEAAAKVEGVEKVVSVDNSAYDRVRTRNIIGLQKTRSTGNSHDYSSPVHYYIGILRGVSANPSS